MLSGRVCTLPSKYVLDKPLLLVFINGLCEVGFGGEDSRVSWFGAFGLFGLIGVVRPLVSEHVAYQEHQNAQDGEDDHSNDAYMKNREYGNVCGNSAKVINRLNAHKHTPPIYRKS